MQTNTGILLEEIKKRAPSTQIEKDFGGDSNWFKEKEKEKEKDKNTQNNNNLKSQKPFSPLPLPVDFEIQDLVKKSLMDENILKIEDLSWLPWL